VLPANDGSADMLPTENYALFQLATDLGKTVRELLDTPGPLTCMERYLWRRWKMARQRLEQQRNRGKGK
jgi:hypothetical protein